MGNNFTLTVGQNVLIAPDIQFTSTAGQVLIGFISMYPCEVHGCTSVHCNGRLIGEICNSPPKSSPSIGASHFGTGMCMQGESMYINQTLGNSTLIVCGTLFSNDVICISGDC